VLDHVASPGKGGLLAIANFPPLAELARAHGINLLALYKVRQQNELGILEFIHAFVETLDRYFENVCELDIMFNIEKAHFILDEMVTNGVIVETNKANVLKPVLLLEKVSK
jgi:hypothetical protein